MQTKILENNWRVGTPQKTLNSRIATRIKG